jgi:dCMP deaminase
MSDSHTHRDDLHRAQIGQRPSFESIYTALALGLSLRSTCRRLNVGTVITSFDHRYVFGVGYNGNAVGLPNDCDSEVPGSCGCIHSEENAIINCKASRGEPKNVYMTHSPCMGCAKKLINLGGVIVVRYINEYRKTDAIELLRSQGIDIAKGTDIARDFPMR